MRYFITSLICLAVGTGIGWYFGYTRPSLQAMHITQELEKETGMSIAEMTKAVPDSLAAMQRQDETAAGFALGFYKFLENGEIDKAKARSLQFVGHYYRSYRDGGGDTNMLADIEQAAQKYPAVATEISREIK